MTVIPILLSAVQTTSSNVCEEIIQFVSNVETITLHVFIVSRVDVSVDKYLVPTRSSNITIREFSDLLCDGL